MKINWAKGFTLIELLIVIAVLGVLAGGVIVAVDPITKINSANLAKVKTFSASVENSLAINQVGKWSFEESASPSKDTSGYANDGDWNGGITWNNATTCGLGFGGCLGFSGAGGYLNIGGGYNPQGNDAITIEVWVKPSVLFGNQTIVIRNGPFISQLSGNKFVGQIFTTAWTAVSGNISLTANAWHHLVLVYGGNIIKLYVDGQFDNSIPKTGVLGDGGNYYIGGWSSGRAAPSQQWFNGLIDEVRVYNQALSLSHVQKHYAQGLEKHQLALK